LVVAAGTSGAGVVVELADAGVDEVTGGPLSLGLGDLEGRLRHRELLLGDNHLLLGLHGGVGTVKSPLPGGRELLPGARHMTTVGAVALRTSP
jgi:hypothetical protein